MVKNNIYFVLKPVLRTYFSQYFFFLETLLPFLKILSEDGNLAEHAI